MIDENQKLPEGNKEYEGVDSYPAFFTPETAGQLISLCLQSCDLKEFIDLSTKIAEVMNKERIVAIIPALTMNLCIALQYTHYLEKEKKDGTIH